VTRFKVLDDLAVAFGVLAADLAELAAGGRDKNHGG